MKDYLTNKFLNNNWEAKDTGLNSYEKVAEQFDNSTTVITASAKPDAIFTIIAGAKDRPDYFRGILIQNEFNFEDFFIYLIEEKTLTKNFRYIEKSAILGDGNDVSLLDEVLNTRTVIMINKRLRLVRTQTMAELAKTMNLSGMALTTNPESYFERNMYMMRKLSSDKELQFIMRNHKGITVIDGVRSTSYPHLPMCGTVVSIVKAIPESFGKPVVDKWKINHYSTRLRVLYQDKAEEFQELYSLPQKLIPGIEIINSDVGTSSLFVRSFWELPSGKIFYQNELKKEHSGDIDFEKIAEGIEKTIFPEFEAIPQRLCKLLAQKLTDNVIDPISGEKTELTTSTKNKHIIDQVLKSVFKQIEMDKACRSDGKKTKGKTISVKLREQIEETFDISSSITAFDVCLGILTLPDYMEKKYSALSTMDTFKKAIGQAPFASYVTIIDRDEDTDFNNDEDEISLVG